MVTATAKIPLRELNYAKTRIRIMNVVLEKIKLKDYENITVEEICKAAEISKGKFFKHFNSKDHIIIYYGMHFGLSILEWLQKEPNQKLSVRRQINYIFNCAVEEIKQYPTILETYITRGLGKTNLLAEIRLTKAEIQIAYPNLDAARYAGVHKENLLHKIFSDLISEGIRRKEFRKDIDGRKTLIFLIGVFFSPPICLKFVGDSCEAVNVQKFYDDYLGELFNNICM